MKICEKIANSIKIAHFERRVGVPPVCTTGYLPVISYNRIIIIFENNKIID